MILRWRLLAPPGLALHCPAAQSAVSKQGLPSGGDVPAPVHTPIPGWPVYSYAMKEVKLQESLASAAAAWICCQTFWAWNTQVFSPSAPGSSQNGRRLGNSRVTLGARSSSPLPARILETSCRRTIQDGLS